MTDKLSRKMRAERSRFADPKPQRTAAEQLARLDGRLGAGVGAVRERARLAARLPQAKRTRVRKSSADRVVRSSMTQFVESAAARRDRAAEAVALLGKEG